MKYLLFISLVLIGGCATGPDAMYFEQGKSLAIKTGYKDYHVAGNVYGVTFVGGYNGLKPGPLPKVDVIRFVNKRSSELCHERGFSRYSLLGQPVFTSELGAGTTTMFSYAKCFAPGEEISDSSFSEAEKKGIARDRQSREATCQLGC